MTLLLFLIDHGYHHYLNCLKGLEIGIPENDKYKHSIFQKICAEYAYRNKK